MNGKKRNRNRALAFAILGCIAALVVFFLVRLNPVARNMTRPFLPDMGRAEDSVKPVDKPRRETQAGSIITQTFDNTYLRTEITTLIRSFYIDEQPSAQYDVDHYTVTFNTTDEDGLLLAVTGQLYVPNAEGEGDTGTDSADTPEDRPEFPVMVFGAGTTGIDDQCAPSKEITSVDNWGDYNAQMLSYASRGYIVLFPDYEGFNDAGRLHHYFHADLESRVMLDSARATYDFFEKQPQDVRPRKSVFFAGYSQGGHAAFGAKDIHREYAPEVPIAGVVSFAGANDIVALMKENPRLAPYLVVAYRDFYGDVVQPDQIIAEPWIRTLEADAKEKCVSDAISDFPNTQEQMYTERFRTALEGGFTTDMQEFGDLLKANGTGETESDVPAMVLQGSADPIVTKTTTDAFVERVCAAGNRVTYRVYEGVHHFQTRQVSFIDTLEWMDAVLEGNPVANDC